MLASSIARRVVSSRVGGGSRAPRRARVAVPGPREAGEARAAAVAVRGEHRADAALAVRVGADDDPARPRSRRASPRACAAAGSRWRCAGRGLAVGVSSVALRRMRLAARLAQPAKGDLHAPGPDAGLLGTRPDGRGSACAAARGRERRLRLGLDRRGLRLRRRHPARLVRRPDRAHQAGRRDPADPGPLAGDDRDDRGHARPPLERPLPARARHVGTAGGRGLARPALRQAARAHARVRGDRAQGARARAARLRGRDLHAAAAGRARQGAEADDRAGAGADPDLHRGDRAEEHAAGRRDRRRLAAGVLLARARRPLALAARGGRRPLRPLARRRSTSRRPCRCRSTTTSTARAT